MGFSRQEYWSGLPFPSLGDPSDSGIKPWSPGLQADSLPSIHMHIFFSSLIKMNHVISLSSSLLTKIHLVLATAAATMAESAERRFQDSSRLWKHQQWICHSLLYLEVASLPTDADLCYCSVTKSCPYFESRTPWTAACQASFFSTISWSLLKFMSVESVVLSNHLILCRSLLLPSIFPSIRVLSNESVLCIMWPKYWSFSFSISLSSEYSVLISFRIDWFDFLAVQGTLKSLLQHHNSRASVLQCSELWSNSHICK